MFEIEQMQMNKHDIKPSKNRLLILNFLNTSNMTHLTEDLFKEKKIVSFVRMQNGEYKYETTLDEHVHFECTKCKKIYNMPSLNDYFEEINKGFSIQETEVLFRGICSDCNK